MKAEGHNRNPLTRNWLHRISLTVKMVVLTILTGLVVWLVLDHALTLKLRNIFHSQLTERLGRYAMEDRLSFDRYVKAFQGAVKLFITQKNIRMLITLLFMIMITWILLMKDRRSPLNGQLFLSFSSCILLQ